jgi:hypothetical protein
MEIEFELERRDLRRTMVWNLFQRSKVFAVSLCALLVVPPLWFLIVPGNRTFGSPRWEFLFFMPTFLLAMLVLILTYGPRMTLKRDPNLDQATASSSAHFDWRLFKRYAETDHLFILRADNGQALAFPKRCFSGPEQMERFREMIAVHIEPPKRR